MTTTNDTELTIGGMTCASCAARIEKKLNRMDCVTATVHYTTEKTKVSYGGGVSVDDLIATVEATGYTARPPVPEPETAPESDELRPLREHSPPRPAARPERPGARPFQAVRRHSTTPSAARRSGRSAGAGRCSM